VVRVGAQQVQARSGCLYGDRNLGGGILRDFEVLLRNGAFVEQQFGARVSSAMACW
jgi:hypothetical protein